MPCISVTVSEKVNEKLVKVAKEKGISKAKLCAQLIENGLEEDNKMGNILENIAGDNEMLSSVMSFIGGMSDEDKENITKGVMDLAGNFLNKK